jgi:demethylmenaquinone methyltransferase/2-methoxy-6-polyprenyl-1,4-benzoquinol methylase
MSSVYLLIWRSLHGMNSPDSQKRKWDRNDLPQGAEKVVAVQEMFDAIAPRYNFVNRLMTFGLDAKWRNRTVDSLLLPAGSRVLDLASGTGDLCIELKKTGLIAFSVDISLGMLKADRSGSPRSQADIQRLPFPNACVDGVTCGFALRNLENLQTFFTEIARVTRFKGRVALLDVSVPTNSFVRFGNSIYFGKIVPLIGGIFSDRAAYKYLPRSVAYLPKPEVIVEMLERSGFADVKHEQLSGGLTQLFTATRN